MSNATVPKYLVETQCSLSIHTPHFYSLWGMYIRENFWYSKVPHCTCVTATSAFLYDVGTSATNNH
jgi:hypothetical protein